MCNNQNVKVNHGNLQRDVIINEYFLRLSHSVCPHVVFTVAMILKNFETCLKIFLIRSKGLILHIFEKYFWYLCTFKISFLWTLSIDFLRIELLTLYFNCKEGIWKWNKQRLKKVELLTHSFIRPMRTFLWSSKKWHLTQIWYLQDCLH